MHAPDFKVHVETLAQNILPSILMVKSEHECLDLASHGCALGHLHVKCWLSGWWRTSRWRYILVEPLFGSCDSLGCFGFSILELLVD